MSLSLPGRPVEHEVQEDRRDQNKSRHTQIVGGDSRGKHVFLLLL